MDAERAHYLKAVESRFLELRGRGMMLSPRDVMLVDAWRTKGVPVRVVVAALEEGAERFVQSHPVGTPLPSSLAYFAGHVERAITDRRELLVESTGGRAGRTGPESLLKPGTRQALLDAIAAAGRRQTKESAREALRWGWRRLVQPSSDEALWELGLEVDQAMVEMLAATLDEQERGVLAAAVDEAVDAAGGAAMGDQARSDVAAAAWQRWIRERFGVRDLTEVLIEHSVV